MFERLTLGEAGTAMDEDESIRQHILRMFIARQGSVQALPDYGLPDLNDLNLSRAELIKETCAGIEQCICQYEPRLHEVEVTPESLPNSPFIIGIQIKGFRPDGLGRMEPWQWGISLDKDKVRGRR